MSTTWERDLLGKHLRCAVRQGEATLFLAKVVGDGATGPRVPVVTQQAPAVITPPDPPEGWTWIVAPGLGAVVEPLVPDHHLTIEVVLATAEGLGEGLRPWATLPSARVRHLGPGAAIVAAGEVAMVDTVAWVDVTDGAMSLTGTTSGWEGAPLPPRLPLVGDVDAGVRCRDLDVVPQQALRAGLEWLYGVLSAEAIAREADRRLADEQRLRDFERASAAAELSGVQVLAEQLRTQPRPVLPRGTDPLVACVGAVLAAHDLTVTAPRGGLGDLEGAAAVRAVAATSRVFHRRVTLEGTWWRGAQDPVLGFRTDGTPLALLPAGNGVDAVSADGSRQRVDSVLAADVVDVGFVFSRPIVRQEVDIPTLGREAVSRRRGVITLFLVWAMVIGLAGLAVPFASGVVFEEIVPAEDRQRLWYLLATLVLISLATVPLQMAMVAPLTRFETMASLDVQRTLWGRVLLSPVTLVRRVGAGDLTMRLSALEALRDPLERTVLMALPALLSGLMAAAVLFFYAPALAAIVLGVSAVLLGLALLLALASGRAQREVDAATGEVNGFLFQVLAAIPKLRVAAAESRAFLAWAQRFAGAVGQRLVRAGGRQLLLTTMIPTLGSLALVGGVTVLGPENTSVPTFVAFQTTYSLFLGGVGSLITAIGTGVSATPAFERAVELAAEKPESVRQALDGSTLRGAVAFSEVVFRYDEHTKPVLDGISFTIEPGEFVAITGRSGSGKSTILRLLLGFETPEAGSVLFDERHLNSLDVTSVRRQLGVVLQDGHLMPGTVQQNLSGMAPVTEEEAWELARLVALDEDIKAMPMKLDTVVSLNGGAFSGGQRQRMLIARALATRPRILLLDEATSSLDNVSQRVITHNLAELGMTRIVVAHRLSTIVEADRIIVVEEGRVAEAGTYDELMAREGRFHSLATRQLV